MYFHIEQTAHTNKFNNSIAARIGQKLFGGIRCAALFVLAAAFLGGIVHAQNKNDRDMNKDKGKTSDKKMMTGDGQYAEVNGARIYYQVAGSGEPMMLIHGYPLNSNLFRDQRDELSKRYKVITPDLRGFGKSVAPDDDASLEVYAKDMIGLMDKLGIQKAIIGGHSMGGMTTA